MVGMQSVASDSNCKACSRRYDLLKRYKNCINLVSSRKLTFPHYSNCTVCREALQRNIDSGKKNPRRSAIFCGTYSK
jgi:hypothetical protein